ncbi:MAG TPA: sulfite exporter TauE/SafE family protein, partial [Stenomitos sp.]
MPYWAAFSLGFLFSFAHCLGMCGGIVAAYSATLPAGGRSDVWSHVLYSLGRTLTYTLIGVAVGALGSAVEVGGRLAGIQGTMSVLAGVVMALLGVGMLGWKLPILGALPSFATNPRFQRAFQRVLATDARWRTFGIGVLNGFLPCGMVYSGAALALSSANPLKGALTMASFGLGTLPAMLML